MAASYFPEQQKEIINSLDSYGYDEAAQYVYGCTYQEWKKRHQKKATEEQMERYNKSKGIHAQHNKDVLATRSLSPYTASLNDNQKVQICYKEQQQPAQSSSILSDVCCQDVDSTIVASSPMVGIATTSQLSSPRPPRGSMRLKVGILTVSDRAAANLYETGDLSGPAVESAVSSQIDQMNLSFTDVQISIANVQKQIVPDEKNTIKDVLIEWSASNNTAPQSCDLIFTTGGTGFSTRDVTPEATLGVLERECQGLMSYASIVLTAKQPLATLSRAAAGTRGNTLIVNLPGNPLGATQVVEILLPLLLHAVKDMHTGHMDVLV